MAKLTSVVFVCFVGAIAALPADRIISKLGSDLRFHYSTDSRGQTHLVDLWLTSEDVLASTRFDPVASNAYHLFTRSNPSLSQPLLVNNGNHLATINFNGGKRTIVLIHGWLESAVSDFVFTLVPAFLAAEDVNVIVVDWSQGASSISYRTVIANTISSGAAVANFIQWLNQATGSTPGQYHIVGHGFGGHQAGIVGRNLQGQIAYITGLNPALVGWVNNINRLLPNDGIYTEVIHTNYILGYLEALAQVDFYPNAGISMPGCDSNACDDARSYFYFAESLLSEGFTGKRCLHHFAAILSLCEIDLPSGSLKMGGLQPKIGSLGVFWLETNAAPPFSQA